MRVYAAALVLVASFAVDPVFAAKGKKNQMAEAGGGGGGGGGGDLVDQNGVGVRGRKQEVEDKDAIIPDWGENEHCTDADYNPDILCPEDVEYWADEHCVAEKGKPSPAVDDKYCGIDSVTCKLPDYYTDIVAQGCPTLAPDHVPWNGPCFVSEDTYAYPKGDNDITCKITDKHGNYATCHVDVTVTDKTPPVLMDCPAGGDILVLHADEYCKGDVPTITATDNCGGAGLDGDTYPDISGLPTGAYPGFELGITPVTVVAEDASGNTDTCCFVVDVQDSTHPEITCPPDIMVDAEAMQCMASVTYEIETDDNCPDEVLTIDGPASGDDFLLGETTVTGTVTDSSGNTAPCHFTVTVEDNEHPTCSSNEITVYTDEGECYSTDFDGHLMAADNCGVKTVTFYPDTVHLNCGADRRLSAAVEPDYGGCGETVSVTVTDTSYNQGTCEFNVIVKDHEDPALTCPTEPIMLGTDKGLCHATKSSFDEITATDNCDSYVDITFSGGSSYNVEHSPHYVTATGTDDSGNTGTCAFTVNVMDNEAPTIDCTGFGEPYDHYGQLFMVGDNCGMIKHVICEDKFNTEVKWDNFDVNGMATYASGEPLQTGGAVLEGHGTCTAEDLQGNKATCAHKFNYVAYAPYR